MGKTVRMSLAGFLMIVAGLLAWIALISCVQTSKTFTIGIVDDGPINDTLRQSFLAGMSQQPHGGGSKIAYIYDGNTSTDAAALDREVAHVMEGRPDALLLLGGAVLKQAGNSLYGKKIPMLFAPGNETVVAGLIKDMRHPGANLSGVITSPDRAKILEWILMIAPSTRRIFFPFDPAKLSAVSFSLLSDPATRFHLELLSGNPRTPDEMKTVIRSLPDGSAILIMTSFTSIADFVSLAWERRIPIFSIFPPQLEEGAVFTFTIDHEEIGRQLARQMASIMQGIPAGDIPVETAEYRASVNLKAAAAMGMDISDDVLRQVTRILR